MIDHSVADCRSCAGTGKMVVRGRGGVARAVACSCPAGRALAMPAVVWVATRELARRV